MASIASSHRNSSKFHVCIRLRSKATVELHAPVQAEAACLLVNGPAGVCSCRRLGGACAHMPQLPGLMPAPVRVHSEEQHLQQSVRHVPFMDFLNCSDPDLRSAAHASPQKPDYLQPGAPHGRQNEMAGMRRRE